MQGKRDKQFWFNGKHVATNNTTTTKRLKNPGVAKANVESGSKRRPAGVFVTTTSTNSSPATPCVWKLEVCCTNVSMFQQETRGLFPLWSTSTFTPASGPTYARNGVTQLQFAMRQWWWFSLTNQVSQLLHTFLSSPLLLLISPPLASFLHSSLFHLLFFCGILFPVQTFFCFSSSSLHPLFLWHEKLHVHTCVYVCVMEWLEDVLAHTAGVRLPLRRAQHVVFPCDDLTQRCLHRKTFLSIFL